MNPLIIISSLGIASYLLGAIPNGFLVARCKGVDIRKVGSGNIGATNVSRTLGKPWGILTFILDALKGFIPAWGFPLLAAHLTQSPMSVNFSLLFGALSIVGHNWPIYLGFKGGKGVATSAGALLGIAPLAVLIGGACWGIVFLMSRYVSVASIATAVAVAIAGWILYLSRYGWVLPAALSVLSLLIIWRHRSNIERLRNGTEHRFTRKQS